MNTVNKPFIAKHPSTLRMPPLGMNAIGLEEDFCRYFNHTLGWDKASVSSHHVYSSCALVLRDRLVERWRRTQRAYDESDCKQAYYLSLEFLMGRALGNALLNLDLEGRERGGDAQSGPGYGGSAGTGERCRIGQRRSGPFGGVLSG